MFKKYDQYFITKFPRFWVLGIHIYVPVLVILYSIFMLVGFFTFDLELYQRNAWELMYTPLVLPISLVCIMLAILYVVRQIKFNNKRVHIKLPANSRLGFFLFFILFFLSLEYLFFAHNMGYRFYVVEKSEEQLIMDDSIFYEHYNDFYPYIYENNRLNQDAEGSELGRTNTEYDSNIRTKLIKLAPLMLKYWDKKTKPSKEELLNHLNKMPFDDKYYLVDNYSKIRINFSLCTDFQGRNGIFHYRSAEMFLIFLILATALAMLLLVVCSTSAADFGWALLFAALAPTVVGVTMGSLVLLFKLDGNFLFMFRFIILLVLVVMIRLSFSQRINKSIRRGLSISIHLLAPLLVMAFIDFDHIKEKTLMLLVSLVMIASTVFYSVYYESKYINPSE